MNEKSKKTFRRKLVALGVMLAVLFGAIAVAGIVKHNDQNAVAYAAGFVDDIQPSPGGSDGTGDSGKTDWEVVKTDYAFKGTAQDDEIMQSMYEIGYFSAKVENGNIVVSFTFYMDYDYTKFNAATYFHNVNFIFGNAGGDSVTVKKKLDHSFFLDPSKVSGVEFPKENDVFNYPFAVSDFTSLTGVTSKKGVSVSSITDFGITSISLAGTDVGMVFSTVSSSDNVLISEVKHYALPAAPEKEGYRFTGWYTDEACTQRYTGETVTDDITLYAGYEKSVFTVTLNTDGETETLTVEYNEAASLPTKTRTGYNFLGWYLPDGTKYDGQAVTSDLTLTAKFEVIMLKVRFFVDGAEYKSVEVPYGSKFSEAVEKASLKQTSVKSVIRLASVAGEGEETPADDQSLPEELTSDIKANVDVSALNAAKEQTTSWFKATWEKIASFFVNLWAKISGFFVTAWEAVCNHFRNNWKWYAIGGGSAAGLAIVIAVICKVRR